jgi:antirestriction protein ArdC
MNDKTNRATTVLAENVSKILEASNFKAALKLKKHMKTYSFNNLYLIWSQCPTASYVMGYQQWLSVGRQVRKGEKSIAIFAPLVRKNDDGEKEAFSFKTASVFDLSQTDGEAVTLPVPEVLELSSEFILQGLRSLADFCVTKGITLRYDSLEQAYGMYSRNTHSITLQKDLPALQTFRTFVHELAHALTPRDDATVATRELEAESCAYLTCDALGLDTSRYSFPYLANWADHPKDILPAAQRACKTADLLTKVISESREAHYLQAA